ncbi:phage tail protein [Phocaeicola barnesiae]|jgi:phage tail-like protein|uniref:phage tail protein n=1 Tax=Bacteroidaceae TaxID=815 RepID=UPI001F227199|nr:MULTISPECIES: phage tail protein [Bacteroidaceae]MCF2738665.1 phage tail protein [Bacteroides caecigallinarum]MDM8232862.1 phage tail protein [Phocaeicola barnesiae]MDM8251133.1 phage tail protein [Phocaeicola barnesiae]
MAGNTTSEWNPPVEFYFLVEFQSMSGQRFHASFSEVNGIGWHFSTEAKTTDSNEKLQMPTGVSYPSLTLKRALDTSGDDFYNWIQNCLKMVFLSGNAGAAKKRACDVVIKLLNKDGQPLAAWSCNHAYPVKYEVNGLDAGRSGLAMETIELVYNRLERIR